MLYEKLGSRFQIQSFTQYYAQQNYLQLPRAAQQTTWINATYAFPHSYLTATSQLVNYNLLGPGSLEVPKPLGGSLAHPTFLQLTANSFQNKIATLPLYENIYEGYGFAHDSVGSQYLNGFPGYWPGKGGAFAPIPVPGLQSYGALCTVQPSKVYTSITAPPTRPSTTRFWGSISTRRRSSSTTLTARIRSTTSTHRSTNSASGTHCRTTSTTRIRP